MNIHELADCCDAFFVSAVEHEEKGKYALAIADYTQAISIDPNDDMLYFSRGNAYAKMGDYDSAIADLTCAISIDPTFPHFYYIRGIMHSNKDDYKSAIADYVQAIKIDPCFAYGGIMKSESFYTPKITKQTYSKIINGLSELGWTIHDISEQLVIPESMTIEMIEGDKVDMETMSIVQDDYLDEKVHEAMRVPVPKNTIAIDQFLQGLEENTIHFDGFTVTYEKTSGHYSIENTNKSGCIVSTGFWGNKKHTYCAFTLFGCSFSSGVPSIRSTAPIYYWLDHITELESGFLAVGSED
jgi:tetratricopeptide (TPR) repeat protein